jgi:general secretion pathway protein A
MYQSYFGLSDAPFSIAPDPRYVYLSQRHQEALAHLLYGVSGEGGFVLLTGDVGAGKTTICRCLLDQIPESCDVAYVFNPKLTVEELLSTICVELGIAYPPGTTSIKVFVDNLNQHLLAANARGRHAVLIIDEAQNLSADVLEQMRLLTNLETNQRKLLQIILVGQPELATMLARPELRQLSQRIVARYHLGPLSKAEVAAYVRHRLEIAGTARQLFPASLMGRLYRLSGGVPRVINAICDRALLGAYVQGKEGVDSTTLAKAADEVLRQPVAERGGGQRALALGLILVVAVAAALLLNWPQQHDGAPAPQPAVAEPVVAEPVVAGPIVDAAPSEPPGANAGVPVVSELDWPGDGPPSRSEALAYAALFRAWGLDHAGGDACREAARQGLRCRAARGGLDELRQLNRPAVLVMRNSRRQEYQAALTGLDDHSATLAMGAETKRVSLDTLAEQWSGYYVQLWRMPPELSENIRQGERGPAVAWLGRQLAQAQGRPVDANADPIFDDALARQVKQFQLAEGLVPDGAVGPQTLMRLSAIADKTAPRLVRQPRKE